MKKYYIGFAVLCLFVVSYSASADTGLGAFFSEVVGIGEDFWTLTTDTTPSMIDRLTAWFLEYYVLMKIIAFKTALELSWSVAGVVLEDLALGSKLNMMLGFLPNDVQVALVELRILDAIELILQAYVARFSMDLIS